MNATSCQVYRHSIGQGGGSSTLCARAFTPLMRVEYASIAEDREPNALLGSFHKMVLILGSGRRSGRRLRLSTGPGVGSLHCIQLTELFHLQPPITSSARATARYFTSNARQAALHDVEGFDLSSPVRASHEDLQYPTSSKDTQPQLPPHH